MQLLTRDELSELLKISKSTVIRYEEKGILKPIRLPDTRTVLYDMEDIKELIESSKESKMMELPDLITGKTLLKDESGEYTPVNQIDEYNRLKSGNLDNLYIEIKGKTYKYLDGLAELSRLNGDDTNE